MTGLVAAVRGLAETSIRARYPLASAREVQARLAERLYGADIAARLFPDVNRDP